MEKLYFRKSVENKAFFNLELIKNVFPTCYFVDSLYL